MLQFCTCLGSDDLFRGLALYHSLTRHAPGSVLRVLCMDREVESVLEHVPLPGLMTVPLAALEAAEPQLRMARDDRSQAEYDFTCIPAFVWHLLTREPGEGPVTLLGAHLFFYSSPATVMEEAFTGSVAMLSHRYPPHLRRLEASGLYDLSWLTFANDRSGRECAAWWRNRCIEGCRRGHGERAARKFLDDWPTRFKNVHVLEYEGAGVAPWNVSAHPITPGAGGPRAGAAPLVFFHFHAFRRLTSWLFDPGLARYGAELTPDLKRAVYLPYLAELRGVERDLRSTVDKVPYGWGRARGAGPVALATQAIRGQLLVAG